MEKEHREPFLNLAKSDHVTGVKGRLYICKGVAQSDSKVQELSVG